LLFSVSCRPPSAPLFPYTTLFRSVARATAKIGATVESDPSINPVIAGCTRCNKNDFCIAGSETTICLHLRCVGSSRVQHAVARRSEEHTSELQSPYDLVCRLLLEK